MAKLEEMLTEAARVEKEHKRKAKQAEALKAACNIYELENSLTEIAHCEHRALNTFTVQELVLTAENLLDISQDWGNAPAVRGQRLRLRNFIKKYGGSNID